MQSLTIEQLKRKKSAFVIWIFLTITIAFFGLLPFISTSVSTPDTPPEDSLKQMQLVFTSLAAIMAVSSLFLRFYVLSEERLKKYVASLGLAPGDQAGALNKLVPQWMMFNILAWGLNESIASLGLMVSTAARNANLVLPFVGVALILNFIMRPDLEETARKAGML